jgi:type 1 fimbria pilin
MKRIVISLLALMLATTAVAAAHDGKKHLLGTVFKIGSNQISIETKDSATIEVSITPSTVFTKDGKPAKLKDIGLGDRVVIHATAKGTGYEASEVQIAKPVKPKPIS